MSKIKQIHPYGPPVGKWTTHPTVAETIQRELKRIRALKEATQPSVIVQISRKQK